MLDLKMKETCRICGRELCGNQRRWIFHPTAKLNLQVLLSHALGQEVMRDGRGEFACSKCTFMLDRMYRFDTVIARVEALSIERLQRLLQEKHRLRQCIGGLYRKTNSGQTLTINVENEGNDGIVDISGLTHAKYCALLQEDLVYSFYESWAEDGVDSHQQHSQCPATSSSEVTTAGSHRCASRRCRGCSHLRVADSDYEAVCKVPRKLARSISCGPSTRYSASVVGGSIMTGGADEPDNKDMEDTDEPPSSVTLVPSSQAPSRTSDSDRTLAGRASSSPSVASLEPNEECTQSTDAQKSIPRDPVDELISDSLSEEHMEATHSHSLSQALSLLQTYAVYRPVHSRKGSRLPVLVKLNPCFRGLPMALTRSVLEMFPTTPEAESELHMTTMTTPDLPVIRLNAGSDIDADLSGMGDLIEDLYKEYPKPHPHQV